MPSVLLIRFSCFRGDEVSLAGGCGMTICPAGQVNGSASQASASRVKGERRKKTRAMGSVFAAGDRLVNETADDQQPSY